MGGLSESSRVQAAYTDHSAASGLWIPFLRPMGIHEGGP